MNNENVTESTDDQWWKQQDEEEEFNTTFISDRAESLQSEALKACGDNKSQALGWLSMGFALSEYTVFSQDKDIAYLKERIKILEKR